MIDAAFDQSHEVFIGWRSDAELKAVRKGKARDEIELIKYLHLQSLVEQNIAKWDSEENPRGVLLHPRDVCRLPNNLRDIFDLPPTWLGKFKLVTPEPTYSPKFSASIEVAIPAGKLTREWRRKGPLLIVGGSEYTLTPQSLRALLAFEKWQDIPDEDRGEPDNQILLADLQKATVDLEAEPEEDFEDDPDFLAGADIELGFADLKFGEAEWVISVEPNDEGGLTLVPTPEGEEEMPLQEVIKRMGQLAKGRERTTFRCNKRIITLSKEQTKRAKDILKRGRLNAEQKERFLKDPNAYLAEYVFDPDDIEWAPRVKGIEELAPNLILANVDGGMAMNVLGVESGGPVQKNEPDGDTGSSPSKEQLDHSRYLPYPHLNLSENEFADIPATDRIHWKVGHAEVSKIKLDTSIFREGVELKPHQEDAVRWMLAHSSAIEATALEPTDTGTHFAKKRGGLLLADDMGLGKTLAALSFIAMRQKQLEAKGQPGAHLIIAPVSLLLNWKAELERFLVPGEIFKRVIVLHGDYDLKAYKASPDAKDSLTDEVDGEGLRVKSLALMLANASGQDGIDQPGNLVFTNYEAVQRYRFSIAAAKWDVMALDEAQATKNPNIMRTAAVKALNAKFRVLMTGTPVENSLVDFWCLNDTHSPGLLSPLKDFTEKYIRPMQRAAPEDHETRQRVANEIKGLVGATMLRRMKTYILDKDFPKKIVHRHDNTAALYLPMTEKQAEIYDSIRLRKDESSLDKHHLALLSQLRRCSLHPDLLDRNPFPIGRNRTSAQEILARSIKGQLLVEHILPLIKKSDGGEKVLIFVIDKEMQWALARNLEVIYPELRPIAIINGDVKIKSARNNPSRQKIIEDFERREGFNICVLSPLAAGVGLNITAANHVVHYQRHWNPAKESQATDRAYRIGQTKDVHVWYPMALHPSEEITSFDQALDNLMNRKMQIQDSILNVEDTTVTEKELLDQVFGPRKAGTGVVQ